MKKSKLIMDYKPNEFHAWCANRFAYLVAPICDSHYVVNHRYVFEHTLYLESIAELISVDSLSHFKSVCRCGLFNIDLARKCVVFRNNYNDFKDHGFLH